ncbi:MAG: glycosyltransferase family 39 protein [Methanobacteriaceae archaeon]|jgi:hypothetical protein|nr:glycosyltransferase family 39 protein [Candidatus Methanorudis spinitermitis]
MLKEQSSNNNWLFKNMWKKEMKSFIGKNRIDLIFIFLIAIFSLVIVYLLINVNNQLGIYCSDVFIYLLNSLNFAGYSIGSKTTMYLSPVVCFLTSLIFRFGFIDQVAIFVVTGLFYPIASIGVYLLSRLHLNKIMSLFGTFLFISFSLNILWLANGSIDIPAMAISIWIIYFLVLAVDEDSKYFMIAFPLFIIGFFTRYTVGFIAPLMILYILLKVDFFDKIKLIFDKNLFSKYIKNLITSKSFKHFIFGVVIATGILIVFLSVMLMLGSDLSFITQTQDVISGNKGSSIDLGFKPDPLFYLTNLLNFISSNKISFDGSIPILQNSSILSYFILGLIILGFLFYIFKMFIKFKKNKKLSNRNEKKNIAGEIDSGKGEKNVNVGIDESNENLLEINKSNQYLQKCENFNLMERSYIKIIGVAMLSILLIATYKEISSVISEFLFLINILLIYNILSKYSIKNLNFNLLMFSWFMIYLIFFSFSNVKVDRYFITVLPVIAYFASYSLNFLIREINTLNFVKNNLFLNLNNLFKLFKQSKQINDDTQTNDKLIANEKIEQNTQVNEKTTDSQHENINKNSQIAVLSIMIPVLLIIIFVMASFAHVETIPTKNSAIQTPIKVSKWLMNYDPDYDSKVIWAYNLRPYSWYLKAKVIGVYEKDLHKLNKHNVTYLIFNKYYLIENYTLIKRFENIYIYKKN